MINPKLPLIDLHRHLDGNVRLSTIIDLAMRHSIKLPAWDVESLRAHVQVDDPAEGVMEFIAKFKWMTEILVDQNACYRVAFENVEDAFNEGLDYVELRFSPKFMADTHKLDIGGVVEAVCDGVRTGTREYGIFVNLIGIISRTYGVQQAWDELNALLYYADYLVAIDLAGDEANQPGDLFVEHFKHVRDKGLQVTVHAGESDGPNSIWQAINELGAVRIGHAVKAIESPELMDYMQLRGIGIESNLTSNVQTKTVRDYASHPIRKFIEKGILTNLNTDDPGISGIDLRYEYEVAAPAAGLSIGMIEQTQKNALKMAFLESDVKHHLMQVAEKRV